MAKRVNGFGIGTGNGSSNSARLHKLLAHHEEIANAIRITLDLLHNGHAERRQARAGSVLDEAIALDAKRAGARRPPKSKRPGYHQTKHQRREATLRLLAAIEAGQKPPVGRGASGGGIGALMRHGYIVKKGDGYARTKKAFVV